MNQINRKYILAISISILFIACNPESKKEETSTSTDSTSNVKPDTTTSTAAPKETTMDAVTAAPNLYKVLNDSAGIRILEVTYKPGDSSIMHSHPINAVYVISPGTLQFTGKDGTRQTVAFKTGMGMIRGEDLHSVKNNGKTTLKALLVEVNRSGGMDSPDAATDATKVAPDLYKVKADSLGLRMVEATYKPGQSSKMHTHPANAVYVISPGTVEFTGKDGTKNTAEFKTGMTMIRGEDNHSVKNTGKTTLKVLLVEVYRKM
jgi:quercetin dioxygenase-like cupin family protein